MEKGYFSIEFKAKRVCVLCKFPAHTNYALTYLSDHYGIRTRDCPVGHESSALPLGHHPAQLE